jgi:hypothetical protein
MTMIGCKSSILEDPTTVINYSVPQASHVKLTVENSYNTLIATLVDKQQQSGYYAVNMDMSNLPEGIYFYTIECKGINNGYYSKITRQILLVK